MLCRHDETLLLNDSEYFIFIRGKNTTFNQGLPFDTYRKFLTTSVEKRSDHPTPKPLDLMIKHILISSKKEDIILDPFLGSGTTTVAAKQLGRNFIGIEISEKYCRIAENRLRQEVLNFN